jgi:hypothetical protein
MGDCGRHQRNRPRDAQEWREEVATRSPPPAGTHPPVTHGLAIPDGLAVQPRTESTRHERHMTATVEAAGVDRDQWFSAAIYDVAVSGHAN